MRSNQTQYILESREQNFHVINNRYTMDPNARITNTRRTQASLGVMCKRYSLKDTSTALCKAVSLYLAQYNEYLWGKRAEKSTQAGEVQL